MSKARWLILVVVIAAAAMWTWPVIGQDAPKEAANIPTTGPASEAPKGPPLFEDWSQKLGADKMDGNADDVVIPLLTN